MRALLDHNERQLQQDFMFGPPPLGPGADPVERLVAFGPARLAVVEVGLLRRAVLIGPPESVEANYPDKVGEDRPLTVTY